MKFRNIFPKIIETLFPHTCIFCQTKSQRSIDLCLACEKHLPWLPIGCVRCALPLEQDKKVKLCEHCFASKPHYDKTYALFYYVDPISRLITGLKFNRQMLYSQITGQLLALNLQKFYVDKPLPEVMIPVPLHWQRLWYRGFNQALEIARHAQGVTGIAIDKNVAIRVRRTIAQSDIPAEQRQQNIKNAFRITKDFNYQHIAIIDDVMTTGHTVNELARTFKQHGVKCVDVWCVARTNRT